MIAIDTRGHGRSTLGTAALTYTQAAEDARQILRHEGVEKYSLQGSASVEEPVAAHANREWARY